MKGSNMLKTETIVETINGKKFIVKQVFFSVMLILVHDKSSMTNTCGPNTYSLTQQSWLSFLTVSHDCKVRGLRMRIDKYTCLE